MKTRCISLLARTTLCAVSVVVGGAQTGIPDSWRTASASPDVFVKKDVIEKRAPRSILLIGENHANVKTQVQLADLLQKLYNQRAIDAILVEGSNGFIDASDLRDSLVETGAKNTAEFWKGQLELGQIAGYEFVALTRDGVRMWGVEDMNAKREYTAGSARRGVTRVIEEQIDLHKRGLALVKQETSLLEAGARQGAGLDALLLDYEAKIRSLVSFNQQSGQKLAAAEGEVADGAERITMTYTKVQPILSAYKKYEAAVGDAAKAKAETDLEAACRKAGYVDMQAVATDLKGMQDLETKLTSIENDVRPIAENLRHLEDGLNDQYFLAANAARSAAGHPLPALQRFLRDERERVRSAKDDPETPFLSDRDIHMVANTHAYLANNPSVRNVALIIGYAHLDGMTNRLRAESVNLLTGKIAASTEETEDWENRAWERRSQPAQRIFSREEARKEVTRFQDDTYKQEVQALLKQLNTIGVNGGIANGKTRIFETKGGTGGAKAIVVTADVNSLRANWGSQVVDRGILPDGSNQAYLVVDRDSARQNAKAFSTASVLFAPTFLTRTAAGRTTQIDLPEGAVSVANFKARVPKSANKVPQRVVLAAEGDIGPLHTVLAAGGDGPGAGEPPSGNGSGRGSAEPPRNTPPGAGSNGRGGEPPWTTSSAHFGEPPDGRIPFVFFTKNMRRASERVKIIEKQNPLTAGAIATIEIGFGESNGNSLESLWFTPERGDHARAFLIAGDNTPEFRQKLKEAADAGLLQNKQIALATCFDPKETDALREMLLDAGALMVWTPENRISPEAARKLANYVEKVDATGDQSAPRGMDQFMNRALQRWYVDSPADPDLRDLMNASQWVELYIPRADQLESAA